MSQEQKERKPNTSKEEEPTASGFLSLLTRIQKPTWQQIPERQGQNVENVENYGAKAQMGCCGLGLRVEKATGRPQEISNPASLVLHHSAEPSPTREPGTE